MGRTGLGKRVGELEGREGEGKRGGGGGVAELESSEVDSEVGFEREAAKF